METEHALIYVNSEAGDLALRAVAWDLLARKWVERARYMDGAELALTDSGEGKMGASDCTLVLLCERSNLDRIFEHLGYAVQAIAVPTLRTTL